MNAFHHNRLPGFAAAAVIGLLTIQVVGADELEPQSPPATGGDPQYVEPEAGMIGRAATVETKLSTEFAEFLGGEARAHDVVEGLRTGEAFTLQTELENGTTDPAPVVVPPGDTIQLSTIDPPTGTMGYGNVRLTLELAEARLAQYGITQPTDEQLAAVLVGGEIDGVQVDGILSERAAGAGWGEIAQRYDLKVGQLMGKAPTTQAVATPDGDLGYQPGAKTAKASVHTAAGQAGYAKGHDAKKGVTTGNGYIPSGKAQGHGAGIVSAQGGGAALVHGKSGDAPGYVKHQTVSAGHVQGPGVVSAGNATAAAVSSAGGQGLAKGHAKQKP